MKIKRACQLTKYTSILVVSLIATIHLTAWAESTTVMTNPVSKKTNVTDTKTSEVLAKGIIVVIDAQKQQLTISHKAISSLNWPAMTMVFSVESHVPLNTFKAGDRIQFTLKKINNNFVVTAIKKLSN